MIIHFTTVHHRDDSRMRDKELASLQSAFGGPVALFVQDGLGDEIDRRAGFPIIDTGASPSGRLSRMTVGGWRMFNAVRRARPKVAHFHDPELLPWAIPLALWGIRVVYDVHEDYPRQIMHSGRLSGWAKMIASPVAGFTEWIASRLLAGIVVVTPTIADRFPPGKTVLVRNYPILAEMLVATPKPVQDRPKDFVYIGTINQNRNFSGMINAVSLLEDFSVCLRLAGEFINASEKAEAEALLGWSRVKFDGWISREDVADALGNARAGLLLLKPVPHEMVALPIKLFEYMASGLPVIASDFPLWRNIIDDANCGLLVNPQDTNAIAEAMQWILDNPQEAQAMGERGRKAAADKYNWDIEAKALTSFYRDKLNYV